MTDLKISQLTAETVVADTDMFPLATVGGYTKLVTGVDLGTYMLGKVNAVKGAGNGIAGLDSSALVPFNQLPYRTDIDMTLLGASSERRITPRVIHLTTGSTYLLTTGSPPVGTILAFYNDSSALLAPATLDPGGSGTIDDRVAGTTIALLGKEYTELCLVAANTWQTVRQHHPWQSFTIVPLQNVRFMLTQPSFRYDTSRWRKSGAFLELSIHFYVSSGGTAAANDETGLMLPPIAGAVPYYAGSFPPSNDLTTFANGPPVGLTASSHYHHSHASGHLSLTKSVISAVTYYGVCGTLLVYSSGVTNSRYWGSASGNYNVFLTNTASDDLATSGHAMIRMLGW